MSIRHNGLIISNTSAINDIAIHGIKQTATNFTVDLSVVEQFATMPTASRPYAGRIVQYTGPVGTYTHGYIYECTVDTPYSIALSGTFSDSSLEINEADFISYVEPTEDTEITLTWDESADSWKIDDENVDYSDYGISYNATPSDGDTIIITYTDNTYEWSAISVQTGGGGGSSDALLTTAGAQSVVSDSTNGWKTFFNGIQIGDTAGAARRVQLYTQDGFFNIFNSAGGSGIRLRNSGFAPYGSSYDLGTSDYEWKNLYLQGKICTGTNSSVELTLPATSGTLALNSAFTGADGTNAGTSGLVTAPVATDNTKYLKGNGTWDTPTVSEVTSQSSGTVKFWTGTQASYDALSPNYDSSTLYIIIPGSSS